MYVNNASPAWVMTTTGVRVGSNVDPTSALDVTGSLKVSGTAANINSWANFNSTSEGSTTTANPGILVYNGGAGSYYGMALGYHSQYGVEFTTGTGTNFFWSSGGGNANTDFTVRMTLNSSNQLGIGVTPAEALHVNGNVRFSGALMPNNAPGTTGEILTSAGAGSPPTWGPGLSSYFGTGTYTPTLTNTANLDGSTAHVFQYTFIIDPVSGLQVVTVSGYVDVDPTTTLTDTQLTISVPISSAFANIQECGGTGNSTTIAAQSAGIRAVASSGNVMMQWRTTDVTSQPMYLTFTYKVTTP